MDVLDNTKVTQQTFSAFSFPQKHKNIFIILLTFIVGIVVGVTYVKSTNQQSKPKDVVTIIGNGYIDVPADEITVYAKVNAKNTDENEKIIKIVKDKLSILGIPLTGATFSTYQDIPYNYSSVSSFSGEITKQPQNNDSNSTNTTTSITLTLHDDMLAQKTSELFNSIPGVRTEGNMSYVLKDSTPFEQKAREQALLDAKKQIEAMKKIQDIKIGKVVAITDLKSISLQNSGGNAYNPPPFESKKVYAEYGSKVAQVRASYEVKYEIQQGIFPL